MILVWLVLRNINIYILSALSNHYHMLNHLLSVCSIQILYGCIFNSPFV